jgi:hypothetical protein
MWAARLGLAEVVALMVANGANANVFHGVSFQRQESLYTPYGYFLSLVIRCAEIEK